jgi:hypothetical protein
VESRIDPPCRAGSNLASGNGDKRRRKLLPGQGVYAHLNAQGKMVAQMTILADADFIWLSLETSNSGN